MMTDHASGITKLARRQLLFATIILIHVVALATNAYRLAPVSDEYGHMYAGLAYWRFGDLEIFNCNPPLIRALGSLPAAINGVQITDTRGKARTGTRLEFDAGRELFCKDPHAFQKNLVFGRLLCSCFSILGALLCYAWARDLYGTNAGLAAMAFWVFQPEITAHGSLITNDIPVTATMLGTTYVFKRWALTNQWRDTIWLGLALGVATSCKFTAVILWFLLPLCALILIPRKNLKRAILQWTVAILLALFLVNIPYGFKGFGRRLDSFDFYSMTLTDRDVCELSTGNRFRGTWVGGVPMPCPEQLLLGIDNQKTEFEFGLPSYAAGMRSNRGWWWFYLFAMLVKLPSGTLLGGVTLTASLCFGAPRLPRAILLLVIFAVSLIEVTALMNGYSQNHRYIFPLYPFLFILWTIPLSSTRLTSAFSVATTCCLAMTISGFLIAAPNWMSSFNWFSGGPRWGYKYLFNDATDWGQDIYLVRDWIERHPENRPLRLVSSAAGRKVEAAIGISDLMLIDSVAEPCPNGIWYIMSQTDISVMEKPPFQGRNAVVVDLIGCSHLVYRIPPNEP